ncbi:hypothetical protein A2V94_07115 [Candidatus Atribacteria bacterium RBG_16_35_8]|nr:MAG: hypothetical protein A2V94_07115 [Candidatus Atribacteria bacterium RBG_16_35_8]
MNDNEFKFNIPEAQFFEKSDKSEGKRRRIGGIASIETTDRQAEILLQKGLDFSEFLQAGWFNDNHSTATTDIVGYPETTKFFEKGEVLPNGLSAKAPCHWVEGYLLDTDKATEIWKLARSLQNTPRRLGLSVEGKIQRRSGPNNSIVSKAIVREVAVTKAPVNMDSQMELLAKSLSKNEESYLKSCSYGQAAIDKPVGEKIGEVGRILTAQSLEKDKLNNEEAISILNKRYPKMDKNLLHKIISVIRELKEKECL